MKKVLLIDPHLDDIALNCSGYILTHDHEFTIVGFSDCDNPVIEDEWNKANSTLGLKSGVVYNYPRRRFDEYRQEILNTLIELREEIKPDIIFCPSDKDLHQDHNVITAETIRAFPHSTIIMYGNHNHILSANFFVPVNYETVDKIWDVLSCYPSQMDRHYFDKYVLMARYLSNGITIGGQYAEAFNIYKRVTPKVTP